MKTGTDREEVLLKVIEQQQAFISNLQQEIIHLHAHVQQLQEELNGQDFEEDEVQQFFSLSDPIKK